MHKFVFLALLTMTTSSAFAEWLCIDEGRGTGLKLFMDTASLESSGDVKTIELMVDINDQQDAPSQARETAQIGAPHLSEKFRKSFNCQNKKAHNKGIDLYSGHMGNGNKVFSFPESNGEFAWLPVLPGTSMGNLWNKVCEMP